MFRYYYKTNISKPQGCNKEEYIRYDGGWWYSEETADILKRVCFKVIKRQILSNNNIFEVIEPIDSNNIPSRIICKSTIYYNTIMADSQFSLQQIYLPQQQTLKRESQLIQSQEKSSLVPSSQGSQEVHLVLSGSLEQDLPEWVFQEIGPQHIQELSLSLANKSAVKPDHGNQSFHSQHYLPHLKLQEEYPLQKELQLQPSDEKHHVYPQKSLVESSLIQRQGPFPQSLSQAPSFLIPKGVQTGSLYPPILLPDEPLPRKSHRHQKGLKQPRLLNHSSMKNVCQIDPSLT